MRATLWTVLAVVGAVVIGPGGPGAAALAQESLGLDAAAGRPFEGIVRPSQEVVLTAPVDGVLLAIPVEEGQAVEQGAVVAQMDDGLQKVAVESAKLKADSEAEVNKATLAHEEAVIMHEQARSAFERRAASEWEVRRAKLQEEQAAADIVIAKEVRAIADAELRLEQEKLDRFKLRAPFAGVVDLIEAEEGATLSTQDQVLSLVSFDPLEATIYLPASLFGQVKVGQKHALACDLPFVGEVTGTVKTVSANFDIASQTFRCVLTIPNPDQKLPAGFIVRMTPPAAGAQAQAE